MGAAAPSRNIRFQASGRGDPVHRLGEVDIALGDAARVMGGERRR